jgi:3-hydroxyacyl-CoA dehydrogenase
MSAVGLKEELRDGVLVLTLANPLQNALTPALRAGLMRALQDPGAARGIVVAADGPSFSAHQPIAPDPAAPSLAELCRTVASCSVPVVAVLHGAVTGPGAELALAARARLALPSTRIAFAEVTLGQVPSGGASVRLPQLIGAKAALRLLLSGQVVPASEALSLGLVDGVTDAAPVAAASRLALALSAGPLLERRPSDPRAWQAAVTEARSGLAGRTSPQGRIIDCVEAALLLPPDRALEVEAAARGDLDQSPEVNGLRAAALAERRGLAIPAVLGRLQPLSTETVGLVGIAPDLARLAVAALSREVSVSWVFPDPQARKAGLAAVEDAIAEGVRAGALAQGRARQMRDRLTGSEGLDAVAGVPLLISDRQIGAGQDWPGLPGHAHLGLGGIAGAMGLALAPAGRVCEVTLGDDSLPIVRATALSGLRRIGLAPVVVGQRPVLGARMADAGRTAIAWMVARGVPRRMVLSALADFGLRQPDPVSMEVPSVLRVMSQVEVLHRWLAALANEGARLIDEGVAKRPSDIDLLMVSGQQFPRWQGGPMHQADRRGLMVLRHDLRAWGAEAALWSPAPLIDRLVGEGGSFAALNDRAGP